MQAITMARYNISRPPIKFNNVSACTKMFTKPVSELSVSICSTAMDIALSMRSTNAQKIIPVIKFREIP